MLLIAPNYFFIIESILEYQITLELATIKTSFIDKYNFVF